MKATSDGSRTAVPVSVLYTLSHRLAVTETVNEAGRDFIRQMSELRKKRVQDTLIEHKQFIDKRGHDLPEICNWRWGND